MIELKRHFHEKKTAQEEAPPLLPCCVICSPGGFASPTYLHASCSHYFHAECAAILFTIGLRPTCPACAAPLEPLPFTIAKRPNHGVTIECRRDPGSPQVTRASHLTSEAQMASLMRHALRANFKSCQAQGNIAQTGKAQLASRSLSRARSVSDELKVAIPFKDGGAFTAMQSPLLTHKPHQKEGPSPVSVFDVPGMTPPR
jgi:hypothetical protein